MIQVCESPADPKTRKPALTEAINELKLTSGIIVTGNEEEVIDVGGGKINVMSAWRFLLRTDIS